MLSYAHGPGPVPLLGETIGENQIAGFKVPRHWKLVNEFPMTVTGKVQKFRMRETSIAELGLQKAAGIVTA